MTTWIPIPYDAAGLLLTRDALAVGMNDKDLRRLLRAGVIRRIRQGAFCEADAWDGMSRGARHQLLSRAVFRTARAPVALTHISGLLTHTDGWWDLPLDEVHLTRLDGRIGRREAGVVQHKVGFSASHIEPHHDLLRSTAARSALEAATVVDFEHSLVFINSLLHEGKTTLEQLKHALVDMYQFPGTRRHELLVQECDPRVESVGETRTYCAMRGRGLPSPRPQFEVVGQGGEVIARLDFALPELKVWVEFDGKVKYEKFLRPGESASDVVLRERDRERQIEALTGWVCVRVTWSDLARPQLIVARIRDAAELAQQRLTA